MWEGDAVVDQWIRDHDSTSMALPNIELEPHLLISKVRKHYMEYLIKLLAENYESNQRLVDKNIYLPSAIWRCAKKMESKAAQASMVVQLYRSNLMDPYIWASPHLAIHLDPQGSPPVSQDPGGLPVRHWRVEDGCFHQKFSIILGCKENPRRQRQRIKIKELKKDTNIGKLNRMLYECLHKAPDNEKKLQTKTTGSIIKDCLCQCSCGKRKRSRKMRESPAPQPDSQTQDLPKRPKITAQAVPFDDAGPQAMAAPTLPSSTVASKPLDKSPRTEEMAAMLADSQSQDYDELMMQLEKLFQADPTDDDLFDSAFVESSGTVNFKNQQHGACDSSVDQTNSIVIESHAAQIKCLDERLASLASLLVNTTANDPVPDPRNHQHVEPEKPSKISCTKWLCEEYYLKSQFFDLLDQIEVSSRKKLERIKEVLAVLFGAESEEEGLVSPLDDSAELVVSCKERLAPWVVQVLTPQYVKGRIKGKVVFKSLAKHLIRIIYQCSRYPSEYEVKNFVADFLTSHKTISCEADFKQFKIDNV